MNKYIQDWLDVIEYMNNDNTYKLAWGRAILENVYTLNHIEENNVITFDAIAHKMVKYYWNQTFFFNLRQGSNIKKKPVVVQQVDLLIEKYKELGAEIEEFSLDIADYSLATYYIIAPAEASSNLGRFDGIRYGYRTPNYTNLKELFKNSRSEGFGSEVKRRIILGTYVLSSGYYDAYYKKAQQVRTLVKQEFKKAFEKYDVILTPTSPIVAFDIGTKSSNPMEMYLSDICTVPVNIAGVPAISIPCGVDSNNMPIGMQLIGNYFDEETILNAAYTYEQATNFRSKYRPNI